jgi:hypothetical protein
MLEHSAGSTGSPYRGATTWYLAVPGSRLAGSFLFRLFEAITAKDYNQDGKLQT